MNNRTKALWMDSMIKGLVILWLGALWMLLYSFTYPEGSQEKNDSDSEIYSMDDSDTGTIKRIY